MVIKIVAGNEYRAMVGEEGYENSFMQDTYSRLETIFDAMSKSAHRARQRNYENHNERVNCCNGYLSIQLMSNKMDGNIILLDGGRGQGKTSTLLHFYNWVAKKTCEPLESGHVFLPVKPLDPTYFSEGESVLQIVASELYHMVRGKTSHMDFETSNAPDFQGDHRGRDARDYDLRQFTLRLQEVIQASQRLKSIRDDFDDLEVLASIADSGSLVDKMERLVNDFLQLYVNSKNGTLVFFFDDLDLCTNNAYTICDQINKYLRIPNVIVVMAANLRQLQYCITQEFIRMYSDLKKADSPLTLFQLASEMSGRYLEKFCPEGHRVYLPDIGKAEGILDKETRLEYVKPDNDGNGIELNLLESYEIDKLEIQTALIKMIYDETGTLLIRRDNAMHPILPQTLRELVHFLRFWTNQMTKDKPKPEKIRLLREYFLTHWCTVYLDLNEQEVIKRLDINGDDFGSSYRTLYKFFQASKLVDMTGIKPRQAGMTKLYHVTHDLMSRYEEIFPELSEAVYFLYTLYLNEAYNEDRILGLLDGFFEVGVGDQKSNLYRFRYSEEYYNILSNHSSADEDPNLGETGIQFPITFYTMVHNTEQKGVLEYDYLGLLSCVLLGEDKDDIHSSPKKKETTGIIYDLLATIFKRYIMGQRTSDDEGDDEPQLDGMDTDYAANTIALFSQLSCLNFDVLRIVQGEWKIRSTDSTNIDKLLVGENSLYDLIGKQINKDQEMLGQLLEVVSDLQESNFGNFVTRCYLSNTNNRLTAFEQYIKDQKRYHNLIRNNNYKQIERLYFQPTGLFSDYITSIYSNISREDLLDDLSRSICKLARETVSFSSNKSKDIPSTESMDKVFAEAEKTLKKYLIGEEKEGDDAAKFKTTFISETTNNKSTHIHYQSGEIDQLDNKFVHIFLPMQAIGVSDGVVEEIQTAEDGSRADESAGDNDDIADTPEGDVKGMGDKITATVQQKEKQNESASSAN